MPDLEHENYDDLIGIVETAHGVRLTPGQIDELNARLDDEERFFPPLTFDEALRAALTGEGPRIDVRAHALAVAADLEGR
jgi:DNA replication protein DnaD